MYCICIFHSLCICLCYIVYYIFCFIFSQMNQQKGIVNLYWIYSAVYSYISFSLYMFMSYIVMYILYSFCFILSQMNRQGGIVTSVWAPSRRARVCASCHAPTNFMNRYYNIDVFYTICILYNLSDYTYTLDVSCISCVYIHHYICTNC